MKWNPYPIQFGYPKTRNSIAQGPRIKPNSLFYFKKAVIK